MIEYLYRYKEAITKLENEKKILKELKCLMNTAQQNFMENQNKINNLNIEKKELEDSINQIIDSKLNKRKRIYYIGSIILITTILGTTFVASNFNFDVIIPTCLCSIIGCYFFNVCAISILEKTYMKSDTKILTLKDLIYETDMELNICKEERDILLEKRKVALINYINQKKKVEKTENFINTIKIDYITPIFDREIKSINNEEKVLSKIKRPNKTRDN